MKKLIHSLWALALTLVMLIMSACSPKELPKAQLENYVANPDNGLYQKVSVRGVEVSVNYRPADLLVAQEIDETADTAEISRLRRKYNNAHYFLVNFSKGGREVLGQEGSFGQFSELLQNFAYRMGEKVELATSAGDTLLLADYAFQRTYGMSSGNALLFAFLKKEQPHEWLEFTLREFGIGTGTIKFRFREQDIASVPALKIESE